ncbi:MAG: 50S ribosomal protein L30 [Nitrospira sp.]|nr:50S ribosomal protein L30 [Nitrospira sp.]
MKKKAMMGITLTRSPIGRSYKQKHIVRGLGLKKLHQTVIRLDTPEIRGMVAKISHLVVVEESPDKPGDSSTRVEK